MARKPTGFQRGPIVAPSQARNMPWTSSIVQEFAAGAKLELDDGRIYRYAQASTTQLEKALMCQSAPIETKWENQVQTGYGAAVGAQSFTVLITTGSSLATEWWNEGWLLGRKGTGIGEIYRINSHTVHATIPVVTIADPGGIRAAIAATDDITIIMNTWKRVVVHPVTTATALACGVPAIAIPVAYWGWLQTRGPCAMTVDTGDTLVIGEAVGLPGTNAVAGAVGNPTDSIAGNIWGRAIEIGEADESAIVYLDLE